jgi:hypothetical protein
MKLALVNSFLSWRMKKRFHQLELFMKYPHEVQSELLIELVSIASNTEFGKKYKFDDISSIGTFKERVPLHFYEDIEADVNRLRQGEQNIFWPGEVKWFAKSSGTTNSKSKFIPVSEEAIEDCHFKGGKDLLSIYCNLNPETMVFDGMNLRMGGSTFLDNQELQSYYGDVSGIIIENLPFWVEMRSTPNNKISLMTEWESKIVAMATTSLREDVTSLAGVPSWMLVLLHFEPYREQYREIIGKDINYLETYNASEGFFGIQDQKDSSEMLLMLDYGIYFEFIPMDKFDGTQSKTIGLSEVEIGPSYAVVITSNAGLWRYIIGDTIRFTNTSPYRFKITGRTKHFINVFGEELIIENAEKALRQSCEKHNCQVLDFTVAPIFMEGKNKGAHQWLIEWSKAPTNQADFAADLDKAICTINSDYEAKRYKGLALTRLELIEARPRLFYDWLSTKGKLGGQNKVPRLSNSREHMDELLKLNH